jgi:hypothetical protein
LFESRYRSRISPSSHLGTSSFLIPCCRAFAVSTPCSTYHSSKSTRSVCCRSFLIPVHSHSPHTDAWNWRRRRRTRQSVKLRRFSCADWQRYTVPSRQDYFIRCTTLRTSQTASPAWAQCDCHCFGP